MDIGAAAEGVSEAMRGLVFLVGVGMLLLGAFFASMDMILAPHPSRSLAFAALALLLAGQAVIIACEGWLGSLESQLLSLYILAACFWLIRGKRRLAAGRAEAGQSGGERPGAPDLLRPRP